MTTCAPTALAVNVDNGNEDVQPQTAAIHRSELNDGKDGEALECNAKYIHGLWQRATRKIVGVIGYERVSDSRVDRYRLRTLRTHQREGILRVTLFRWPLSSSQKA